MAHVTADITSTDLQELRRKLTPDQIRRATARAINHTTAKAQTPAKRTILTRYNLHRSQVQDKRLKQKRATPSNLNGGVNASTRPIPLISFAGTHAIKTKGVAVTIIKGQKRIIKGAFITTTKAGRRAVFARGQHTKGGTFEWRHKRIVKRGPDMPIEELSTVSIFATGMSAPVQDKMESVVKTSYPQRLVREMENIIKGITT